MLRIPFPTTYREVSSPFGPRWGKFHDGVDFPTPMGTSIAIPFKGFAAKVAYDDDGYGYYVVIEYTSLGICMLYAHLKSDHGVVVGQKFDAGDIIKEATGNSGFTTGPHLHVEIRTCLYGIHFWDNDPVIDHKETYTVDPMWFFFDYTLGATEIRARILDEPEDWESFKDALLVIREMAPWFDTYTEKVYRKE